MKHIKGPTDEDVEAYKKALPKRMRDPRDERGLKRSWVASSVGRGKWGNTG